MLYSRYQHNLVNQLYFHEIKLKKVSQTIFLLKFIITNIVPTFRNMNFEFNIVNVIQLFGSLFQELSLRLAEKENARIVLATDPDADRLAVAELQEK